MCGCKNKISRKMAKKKSKGFTKALTKGAAATVGVYGSNFLDPVLGGNQMIAGGVKMAAGAYLATMDGEIMEGLGIGLMFAGGSQLIGSVMPATTTAPSTNGLPRGNYGHHAVANNARRYANRPPTGARPAR